VELSDTCPWRGAQLSKGQAFIQWFLIKQRNTLNLILIPSATSSFTTARQMSSKEIRVFITESEMHSKFLIGKTYGKRT
jgi:hypothetical protein